MIAIVFWLTAIAATLPVAIPIWYDNFQSGSNTLLPLLALVLAILIGLRLGRLNRLPQSTLARLLAVWGFVSLAIAYSTELKWFGALAACLFLVGLLITAEPRSLDSTNVASRNSLLQGTLVSLAPLVLIFLPWPGEMDAWWLSKVQSLSARLASMAQDGLRIPNVWSVSGLELETINYTLLQIFPSVFSPIACGFVLITLQCWRKRPVWLVAFYFLAGQLVSIAANVAWVVCLSITQVRFGRDLLGSGYQWIALGIVAIFAIFISLSLDRFLLVTLFPTRQEDLTGRVNPLIAAWNSLWQADQSRSQEVNVSSPS